jgi:hypothetical protein
MTTAQRLISRLTMGAALALVASVAAAQPYVIARFEVGDRASGTRLAEHTSRCVGAMQRREMAIAKVSCNRAVTAAHSLRFSLANVDPSQGGWKKSMELAVAYSNRAVMHQLSGNIDAARADLLEAAQYAPDAPFIQRNSTAFDARDSYLARQQR